MNVKFGNRYIENPIIKVIVAFFAVALALGITAAILSVVIPITGVIVAVVLAVVAVIVCALLLALPILKFIIKNNKSDVHYSVNTKNHTLSDASQMDFNLDGIDTILLRVSKGRIQYHQHDVNHLHCSVSSNNFYYEVSGNSISIAKKSESEEEVVHIYLPKKDLTVKLDLGAGEIFSHGNPSGNLKVNLGAGEFIGKEFSGDVKINNGAGNSDIEYNQSSHCGNISVNVALGNLSLKLPVDSNVQVLDAVKILGKLKNSFAHSDSGEFKVSVKGVVSTIIIDPLEVH